ncbi:SDR family NAD(P)-dependent oxidoreductase [Pseudomonas putida]|uniref:SDR family NAD(P)-dependent oxidoreductase n=1 Tax=Pseudomonas putida TaxID=303 RepID=A0AAD0L6A5_PSEPU|nr:SDR family NAD(P)-dependent oxidoreductase [Pseudomonas putida]AXA23410.1 SDR family NAD(P)-dependent oxidoreductase [Pseudomonas putida]
MSSTRRFWVTGASNGVGLALVERLLEEGHRVAASGKNCQELDTLAELHEARLLRLPVHVHELAEAQAAAEQLQSHWGALDVLIVNAGTCDYLPDSLPANAIMEAIVSSNRRASEHVLANALSLLARGDRPQVMALFSRYSTLQLFAPAQNPAGHNSLPQWFREQRKVLDDLTVQLTVVAPQSLKAPVSSSMAIPESWTAQSAAEELVRRLEQPQAELVLEVMDPTLLWPLPKEA